MAHIRVFRHYIHTPYVYMALFEALIIFVAAYLGFFTRFQEFPPFFDIFVAALIFSITLTSTMVAMGVYGSRLREGFTGMMLRTAVSFFLLGTTAMAVFAFFIPLVGMGRGVLLFSTIEAFVLISIFRWTTYHLVDENTLKRKVLVVGVGHRAKKIAARMRRASDRRAFLLVGFWDHGGADDQVSEFGAHVIRSDEPLDQYCLDHDIDEIVVAMDERRRREDSNSPGLPLDALMNCRLSGVEVCEVQAFIERESGKVDVELLHPSWVIFSDGFVANAFSDVSKRVFDLLAASLLLFVTWPIMAITAFLIAASSRFRDPVIYRQERVGLNNEPFEVMKFRSMRTDAESSGAVWASQNDPRVTRIGAVIRKTRIDELPQLFNVLRGDMSFVGPRPERPVFVGQLAEEIDYYEERHRVKPGITGWAQLCYPYGASVDDAKEKLQYDLYYLKNQSLLLDLIILLQTVEVVLVGEGAR